MKNLLACLAVIAAFSAGAQSTMPYNPDADDDSYIGVADVLGLLPLYGQQFGIDSSLTCDYDGTPIEEFWANVYNGDIIIDSMLVQYHTVDSAEVFFAGCPDPVWETVSYERAWTVPYTSWYFPTLSWESFIADNLKFFRMWFSESNGRFHFQLRDGEIDSQQLSGVLGSSYSDARTVESGNSSWTIPFPTDAASFDENGIHFEYWNGFLSNATYVNILPYWHYAE